MLKVYLWNGGSIQDIVVCKPLVKQLLDNYTIDVVLGCLEEHAYLLEDLQVKLIKVKNNQAGSLLQYCPPGYEPLQLGPDEDNTLGIPDWRHLVGTFNRRVLEKGLPITLKGNITPMIGFKYRDVLIRNDAIYVQNAIPTSTELGTILDIRSLSEYFPGLNFYCAADPGFHAHNVYDCSSFDLVVLSSISNQCDAIVGTEGEAFVCTFTEANRYKSRALIVDTPRDKPVWGDYPGNPLEYIVSRDGLMRFLVRVAKSRKLSLLYTNFSDTISIPKQWLLDLGRRRELSQI